MALKNSGLEFKQIGVRGSSVTGVSSKGGPSPTINPRIYDGELGAVADAKSITQVTDEMKANPYHKDWQNYVGNEPRAVGADVVDSTIYIDSKGSAIASKSELPKNYKQDGPGKISVVKGPSGKVSTQKFLENNWDKATFGTTSKSVEYHVAKYGKGLDSAQYTQRARAAWKNESATKIKTTDLSNREAVKVISDEGTGLFTNTGKIIWFQPK